MPKAVRPGQRWLMGDRYGRWDPWRSNGSILDTFRASRQLCVTAMNDDCCREKIALVAVNCISDTCAARELDALARP
jgi:hypothetical protein